MMNSVLYVVCLILGGASALFATKFGYKLGMVDVPSERSSHTKAMPKGGGIGILAAFVLSSLLLNIPPGLWVSAAILTLISFYGDKSELSPKFRLLVQFIAAVVFLCTSLVSNSSFYISSLVLHCHLLFSGVWILFLAIFIVATANFYNFMDGINGIAAITGIVGFGLLAFFANISGADSSLIILSICMAFSCLGFLPFNMPRAKVFMGDVGSILLGFVFAGMIVLISKSFLDFICLTAFLFTFYADELTTMMVRIKDSEKLNQPHRRHLYQLLANEYRIPHWKISMAYGVTQFIIGISVMMAKNIGSVMVILMLVVYFCGFAEISWLIRKKLVGRIG